MPINPFQFYTSGKLNILDGTIPWITPGDISAYLCTSAYTPSTDHTIFSDLTGHVEQNAITKYSPKVVTGRSTLVSGIRVLYSADPVSYGTNTNITARYMVLVHGNPFNPLPTDPLIGYFDFGGDIESINSDFSITPLYNVWFSLEERWVTPVDIPINEADALKTFFYATGGALWVDNTNWGETQTASDWYGVTVTDGHVSQLTSIQFPVDISSGLPLNIKLALDDLLSTILGTPDLYSDVELPIWEILG